MNWPPEAERGEGTRRTHKVGRILLEPKYSYIHSYKEDQAILQGSNGVMEQRAAGENWSNGPEGCRGAMG